MTELQQASVQTILEQIAAHANTLRQMGVVRIGLFGSWARGEPKPDSDVDILVKLADDRFRTFASVKLYLEDLLGRKVDLALEDALREQLRPHITSEVVYAEGV